MRGGSSLPVTLKQDSAIPIRRRALHEEVTERVRDMIIEGELSPGERINENQLISKLGVSRTPLREAMRTLAAENLIDTIPSRGSVVRKLAPKDVYDMLQVLAELEGLAGQLTCRFASQDAVDEILQMHRQMMSCYEARDRLAYYKINQSIHSAVSRASGNAMLAETQAAIQARLKRIRFIGNDTPENWAGAVAEHREMDEALRNRDGERLSSVLKQHILVTWDRVKDVV